jgi:hypothetical protein
MSSNSGASQAHADYLLYQVKLAAMILNDGNAEVICNFCTRPEQVQRA